MTIDEEEEFAYAGFRAQPVPVFPEVTPTGIQEHLTRMQKSREYKRMTNLKPIHAGNSQNEVGPFTLS
jgi:hypothetical protein